LASRRYLLLFDSEYSAEYIHAQESQLVEAEDSEGAAASFVVESRKEVSQ
jgi:hypothetical protein